jgi:hypothetical protein
VLRYLDDECPLWGRLRRDGEGRGRKGRGDRAWGRKREAERE